MDSSALSPGGEVTVHHIQLTGGGRDLLSCTYQAEGEGTRLNKGRGVGFLCDLPLIGGW